MLNHINTRNKQLTLKDVRKILEKANISKKPKNIELYQQSFTHKSYVNNKCNVLLQHYSIVQQTNQEHKVLLTSQPKSYEKLEFYGDSIVAAATVEYLYKRYGEQFDEGQLTKLKNRIVSSTYLAKFAKYFGFSQWIVLSVYVETLYGRSLTRILEDCFEAFIGAISLDVDYGTAKEFMRFCIDNLVDFGKLLSVNDNYKDIVLNNFQIRGWNHPKYEVDTELGPQHRKSFVVNIIKSNPKEIVCQGVGKTKKEAEMDASYNALVKFGVMNS